jgi:UDP-N-acetyl-D-glucosamine dehydrogenase
VQARKKPGHFADGQTLRRQKLLLPRTRLRQAGANDMTIAIIGLGYVGLPLCLQFARSGVRVLGLDIDAKKVAALNAGRSYIRHISSAEIKKFVRAGKFLTTTDFSQIGNRQSAIYRQPF